MGHREHIQFETDKRYLKRLILACGVVVAALWGIFIVGERTGALQVEQLVSVTSFAGQCAFALLGLGLVAQAIDKKRLSFGIACLVCLLIALQALGVFAEPATLDLSDYLPIASGIYDGLALIVLVTSAVILLIYSVSGPRSFYSPSMSLLGVMVALFGLSSLIVISIAMPGPEDVVGLGMLEGVSYFALGTGCSLMAWRHFVQAQFTHEALARAIVIYTNFGVCLVALVTAIFVTLPFFSHLHSITRDNLAEVAEFKASSLEQFFSKVRAEAKYVVVAVNQTFGERIRLGHQHMLTNTSMAEKKLLESLLDIDQSIVGYKYFNTQGQERLRFGEALDLSKFRFDYQREFNYEVLGPVIEPGSSYFVLVKSLKFRDQVIGQHVCRISPDGVRRILENSASSLYVNASFIRAPSPKGDRYFRYDPQTFALQRFVIEGSGIEEITFRNKRVHKRRRKFFAVAPISTTALSVVLFTDTSELDAVLRSRAFNFAVIALAVGLLASVGMYLLTNEFKKRLLALEYLVDERGAKNQAILSGAPDAVVILYGNKRIENVSHAFERLTELEEYEVQGKSILEYLSFEKPIDSWLESASDEDAVEIVQGTYIGRDQQVVPLDCTVSKLRLSDGIRYLLFVRDVTETRAAQTQMSESLKEKEVLLKEIHHRVKNNLQVISSLLRLQSRGVESESFKSAFEESQHRVHSIALLHELLYQSGNLAAINFEGYLTLLCEKLFTSYAVEDRIKLVIDVDDAEFSLDVAMPCGLIVNETVTNSIKHAFPGNKKGTIRIIGKSMGAKRYSLTIEDDGVGMQAEKTTESSSGLGSRLVSNLVTQLQGSHEVDHSGGTRHTIEFDVSNEFKDSHQRVQNA